jgi:DNA-binding Lrp family transcriptional regulator
VVTAYILIQTEVGKAAKVAKDIVDITGVLQAQAVTGPYDVIVRAEAHNIDELGQLVVARVQAVDGITRTLTCPVVHLSRCSITVWCPADTAATELQAAGAGPRRTAAPEARQ